MKRLILAVICCGLIGSAQAGAMLDVFRGDDLVNPIGQIETIENGQGANAWYNYYSDSGHPAGINLAAHNASFFVHENAGMYTFGFIAGKDSSGTPWEVAMVNFVMTGSDSALSVIRYDDTGDGNRPDTTFDGSAFAGHFEYTNNTDGVLIGGLTGSDWCITIGAPSFYVRGSGEPFSYNLYAANGGGSDIAMDGQSMYMIKPAAVVPAPGAILLGGLGTSLVGWLRRRRSL